MSGLAYHKIFRDFLLKTGVIRGPSSASVDLKLGDAAGARKFRIYDSSTALQASIDSDGNAIFVGTLQSSGNATLSGSAAVSSSATSNTLNVSSSAVTNTLTVSSSAVANTLTVSSSAVVNTLTVSSGATVGGTLTASSGLGVTAASTFSGAVSMSSGLAVTAASTFAAGVTVGGTLAGSSNVTVANSLTGSSNASVAGTLTLSSAGKFSVQSASSDQALTSVMVSVLTATGGSTYSLPTPAAGLRKIVLKDANSTQIMLLNTDTTGVTIDGTNTQVTLNGRGQLVDLVGLSTTRWLLLSATGQVGNIGNT